MGDELQVLDQVFNISLPLFWTEKSRNSARTPSLAVLRAEMRMLCDERSSLETRHALQNVIKCSRAFTHASMLWDGQVVAKEPLTF